MFKRTWVSPLVAISFVAVGLTGVLMLFHVHLMGMKSLHEWMGVVMVAAGTVHLILNWKAFLAHFKSRAAFVALAAGLLIGVALVFGGGEEGGLHGFGPGGPHGPNGAPHGQNTVPMAPSDTHS